MIDNIVLIDDNDLTNFLHESIVESYNGSLKTTVFNEPLKALDFLKQCTAASVFIFLDLNMPMMSGWELLEAIDDIKEKFENKICILSSTVDPEDIKKAKNHIMVHKFLEKPLSEDYLKDLDIPHKK